MFRALSYPLILAMAVGPVLCCCTAGRALAAANTPPATPAPAQPVKSCCSHKQKPATPKPAPAKPEQCPCKDGAKKVQAVPTATSAADVNELLRAISLDSVNPGADAVERSEVADRELAGAAVLPPPFPSSSELLFAHHRLRC
jgi:hypothetical protein